MTKRLIFGLALFLLPLLIIAGIPKIVSDNFKMKFPTATHLKWHKEKNGDFEAEFKVNGKELSANFDKEGNWLETETEIDISKIPSIVITKYKALSGNAKIIESAQIEANSHNTWYEIEYRKGLKRLELFFDADGNQVNKS